MKTKTTLQAVALLTAALGGAGWLLALGWQAVVHSALESSGAQLVTTDPSAVLLDKVAVAAVTALMAPAAAGLMALARRIVGRSAWPLWLVVGVLFIGENLAISLRLITLATITLRAAVEAAVPQGQPPTVDLAAAALAPWALAGVVSGAVLSMGLLLVLGQLQEEEGAAPSTSSE